MSRNHNPHAAASSSTGSDTVPKPQRRFFLVNKRKSQPALERVAPAQPPPSLSVRVHVEFASPLDFSHDHTYQASSSFQPTEDICQGLLRRLDHGCAELLTRKDSAALDSKSGPSGEEPLRSKAIRAILTFTIIRAGRTWAVKSYKSYQELPLDGQAALDVTQATDQIIGPFLKYHDQNYVWHPREHPSTGPETPEMPRSVSSNPVSLASVPPCRFVSSKQDYDAVPGYEISLTFRSRRHLRCPATWERRIIVKSQQSTPVTLALGEDLTWQLSRAMNDLLDGKKRFVQSPLDEEDCDGMQDSDEVSLGQDSLHVGFSVSNKLGTDYTHFCRSIDTRLALFPHPDALDCLEFTHELERAMTAVRDDTDAALDRRSDLKINIRKLSGHSGTSYWTVKSPFTASLDSSICYPRRTVQAILDRVQTGIADVLRGKDVSITIHATKRGHAVLDKTLVSRADLPVSEQATGTEQRTLLANLKERIQADMAMVIRDTCCSLDKYNNSTAHPPNLRLSERRITHFRPPTPLALPEMSAEAPQEAHEPASMDELISRSMALFAELGDDSPETANRSGETRTDPTRGVTGSSTAQLPETPEGHGVEWAASIPRRDSSAGDISFTMSSSESASRFSTRSSSSDRDTETPNESFEITPASTQGTWHREKDQCVAKRGDESQKDTGRAAQGTMSERPATTPSKEPRRFSLLGRNHRQRTPPAAAEVVKVEIDESPSPQLSEGWLGYSCEPVEEAGDGRVEEEPATEAFLSEPTELQDWLGYYSEPIEEEADETIETPQDTVAAAAAAEPTTAETPEPPHTPAMTDDDSLSDAEDSINITPAAPFPGLDSPAVREASSSTTTPAAPGSNNTSIVALWPGSRSRSADFPADFEIHAPESPSKKQSAPPRPSPRSLSRPRPRSAHAISLLSNPWPSLSPACSPSAVPSVVPTPRHRPHLGSNTHRRQLSTPTAGYLGLLHAHGSPLWRQVHAYQQQKEQKDSGNESREEETKKEQGAENTKLSGGGGGEEGVRERRFSASSSFWGDYMNQNHQTGRGREPLVRPGSSSMRLSGLGLSGHHHSPSHSPAPSRPVSVGRDSGFWEYPYRSRSGSASSGAGAGGQRNGNGGRGGGGGGAGSVQPRVGGMLGGSIWLN